MIYEFKLNSKESLEFIANNEEKHIWYDGEITRIYTGEDIPKDEE
jgi:hypothetical protein